jgi:hypothetical protein
MSMLLNPFFVGAPGGGGGGSDADYASVVLLLACDGTNGSTTLTDNSGSPATPTCQNGAALSTTQKKFGTASLFLDGTNDYVQTGRGQGIGSGQFTLEAHVRCTGAVDGRVISSQDSSTVNPVIFLRTNSDGSVTVILRNSAGGGTFVLSSAASLITMNDSTWYHLATTRDGSNRVDIWIDGVSVANGTSGTSPAGAAPYVLGSQYGSGEFFQGYIDNVRITEGVCRYTGTFTPPAAAYPTS